MRYDHTHPYLCVLYAASSGRQCRTRAAGRTAASSAASSGASIWKYTGGPADPEAIYDHPELYEMAFSYRDVKKEVRPVGRVCGEQLWEDVSEDGYQWSLRVQLYPPLRPLLCPTTAG